MSARPDSFEFVLEFIFEFIFLYGERIPKPCADC